MTSVSLNNAPAITTTQIDKSSTKLVTPEVKQAPLKIEASTVTISEEGKALLSALSETEEGQDLLFKLSEIDHDSDEEKSTEITKQLSSFAHGALGLDKPESDEVAAKEKDTSYTAGKYLKGALTVGSILLAIA
ncbi:hypothetical protein ACR30L_15120 [Psychromonas sp. PT13]|uniref:hypothetical protein n=1 Tax=Psychromonas sp. PT13 TaxID=3439547 RepID=UPI003EBA6B00